MSREERVTWCGLCHARPGLVLELENGRTVAVCGDSEHPANRGRTCRRGRMMLEHLYHPDRLDRPLRRTGERGGGGWETVSWEQALDDIAHRLEKLRTAYGAETLAFGRGTYRTYHWNARRFLGYNNDVGRRDAGRKSLDSIGAPGGTRTPDRLIRRQRADGREARVIRTRGDRWVLHHERTTERSADRPGRVAALP